jgi:hypothetical protein
MIALLRWRQWHRLRRVFSLGQAGAALLGPLE